MKSSAGWNIIYYVYFLFVAPNIANALTIDWARQLGTSGSDFATGVAADQMGNVFVVGGAGGSLAGPFGGSYCDAFVAKYDELGNALWKRQLGTSSWDEADGVVVDEEGSAYVTGITGGTLGSARVGNADCFVRKFDASGNVLWTTQFPPGATLFAGIYESGIAYDGIGALYVAGSAPAGDSPSTLDAYVAKLDRAGNLLWKRQFGSNVDDKAWAVAADALGNVFVTGSTDGDIGGPHAGTVGPDAFITKFDATGKLVWSRQLGDNFADYGFAAATDRLGNVYVGGATQSELASSYGGGFHDAFVTKYDSAGNQLWIRQVAGEGADEAYAMTTDPNGGVYVTGNTDRITDEIGRGGSFIANYDADGKQRWIDQMFVRGARGIALNPNAALFIGGRTLEGLDGANVGTEDAFVLRVENVPEPSTLLTGMVGVVIASALCLKRRNG